VTVDRLAFTNSRGLHTIKFALVTKGNGMSLTGWVLTTYGWSAVIRILDTELTFKAGL